MVELGAAARLGICDAERIDTLRARLLERKDRGVSGAALQADPVITARALRDTEGMSSWQRRRGLVVQARLRALRFDVDDLELLAGRVHEHTQAGTAAERDEARQYLARYPGVPGQTGHCELDLEPLMAAGIDGLDARIRARLAAAQTSAGDPAERADAYASFLDALSGLSSMIDRAAGAAETDLATLPAGPRAVREVMAASCRRVAHRPPETFQDAVQLLWLTLAGVMQGEPVGLVVPGHLDRTLYPFYARDLAAGRLDEGGALLLLESLYLLVNEFIPDGLAISVMVGGRDAQGRDLTNPLSYLCLEALRRTALI
jgi:hypothetical protein